MFLQFDVYGDVGSTPCQGDSLYSQDFSDGLPTDWKVVDNDSLTTADTTDWPASWQEYLFEGNKVMGNMSWYNDSRGNKADDYLITQAIALPSQPACLSFRARSVKSCCLESYEIKISTTKNAINDFQTTLLKVEGENPEWTTHTIDMGSYVNDTIYIAFHHTSADQYVLILDDISITKPLTLDLKMSSLDINSNLSTTSYPITGKIENFGSTTVTSFALNWNLDGGAVNTDNLTGLNIAPYSTYSYTHTVSFSLASSGTYTLAVWTSNVNNSADLDSSNDSISKLIAVTNGMTAKKKVLIEEYTGAWCGACTDGHWVMDTIHKKYYEAIGIRVHQNDDMEISIAKDLLDSYPTAYPTGIIDRATFSKVKVGTEEQSTFSLPRTEWAKRTVERINMNSPVEVSITKSYNASTRELVATIEAKFVDYAVGDLRFLAHIKEDSVSGTGSRYDQTNYSNNDLNSPYYGLGNPIKGYQHRDVLRALPFGPWGKKNSISSKISPSTTVTDTFHYTIPDSSDPSRIRIVASVYLHDDDESKRQILNVEETTIWTTGIDEKKLLIANENFINFIYPNPANAISVVNFTLGSSAYARIEIYNVFGQKILILKEALFTKGNHSVYFNANALNPGLYF
ncbi:choice-of-anchor J domain-containing protein, partial [Bacteroidales bacterium AH-315-N07]|nr:choice-of-anchor J domain-containing protein [Bacteroidales bacterium AH-315-N07]